LSVDGGPSAVSCPGGGDPGGVGDCGPSEGEGSDGALGGEGGAGVGEGNEGGAGTGLGIGGMGASMGGWICGCLHPASSREPTAMADQRTANLIRFRFVLGG
tara:strand:+ start:588 stop:893 length:306 start_codon:yes stop_codon:yes gene_type:complete